MIEIIVEKNIYLDTTVEEVVTTTEIKDSITEITTGVITGITTQTEVCQAANPEVVKAIHVWTNLISNQLVAASKRLQRKRNQ